MLANWPLGQGRDKYNFLVYLGFLGILLLFGGASRADVLGQGIVRIAAIAVLVSSAIQLTFADLGRVRAPLLIVLAIGLVAVLQLIPLPPAIWAQLPGHGTFAQMLEQGGIESVSRPLSLTPDMTLNALLALLPPLAALSVLALIPRASHSAILLSLLFAIVFSMGIGTLQIAAGGPYFYEITNYGSAVGVFANRNHGALFVALALPLLATWFALPRPDDGARNARLWVLLSAPTLVFPVLLVTGSRGGLLLGAVGAAAAIALALGTRGSVMSRRGRLAAIAVAAALVIGSIVLFVLFARDEAFRRLVSTDQTELRSDVLPTILRMIGDFFPAGSGLGSFDSLYRFYELHENLGPYYLNHAHNDLAEIALEAGFPGLLLVGAGTTWWLARSASLWRAPYSTSAVLGRAGSVIISMIAVGSLFDYPLRTPLISVVFIMAAAWMCVERPSFGRSSQDGAGTVPHER